MCNTPDAPAKKPDDRMNQGGNYWTLFTPGIWKDLHAVFHPELRGRIKVVAFRRGLTVADMLRELLAREFPDGSGAAP